MNTENTKKNEIVNPEPDWSLMMFWEDITAIVARILELIRSIFGA